MDTQIEVDTPHSKQYNTSHDIYVGEHGISIVSHINDNLLFILENSDYGKKIEMEMENMNCDEKEIQNELKQSYSKRYNSFHNASGEFISDIAISDIYVGEQDISIVSRISKDDLLLILECRNYNKKMEKESKENE